MDNLKCPNKDKHISAFPAYDREKCPYCKKTYVLKEKELTDEGN